MIDLLRGRDVRVQQVPPQPGPDGAPIVPPLDPDGVPNPVGDPSDLPPPVIDPEEDEMIPGPDVPSPIVA